MPEFPGRLRTPRLPLAPSSPALGEMYYDTTTNKLYWWNGSSWIEASGTGGASGGIEIIPNTVGDDSTDETTIVQNALNSVGSAGGGIVQLKKGKIIHTGLVIGDNVILQGAGPGATILKLKNGSPAGTHCLRTTNFSTLVGTDTSNGESGFSVRDLTIDGNKANNASGGHGLAIYGYAYTLHNVRTRNCHGDGIYSEWRTTSSLAYDQGEQFEAFWNNVKSLYNQGNGITFDGPHDSYLNEINAVQNDGHGVHFKSKAPGVIVGTTHSWGIRQNNAYRLDAPGIQINNVIAEGSRNSQVHVRANDCSVLGGNVYNGFQAAGTNKGIQIGDTGVSVTSTRVEAYTHGLDGGHIIFTNCGGGGRYQITAYNSASDVIASGFAGPNSVTQIEVTGSSTWTSSYIPDERSVGEFSIREVRTNSDRLKFDTAGKVVYWPNGIDHRLYSDNYSTEMIRLRGDNGAIVAGAYQTRRTSGGAASLNANVGYYGVTGSGARTVTLPAASSNPGLTLVIKDEVGNAEANVITIARTGSDTIDGATSKTINVNYGILELYSTGSGWMVLEGPKTFRTGHTWAVAGTIAAATLPPIFVPEIAGQATSLVSVRAQILSGTNVTAQVQRNGSNLGSAITVTTTAASTSFSQTITDLDRLGLVLSAPTGSPADLTVTAILEHVV